MDKEDFVHKRNHDKGNFYSKDFTLEEVNQLIKDEEDAKKWNEIQNSNKMVKGFLYDHEIVERLKKRIKEVKELTTYNQYLNAELQKILGEDNITAHIGGVTFGEKK